MPHRQRSLMLHRKNILHSIGSEDYAIVIAQFLAVLVSILNILSATLGGEGRHIETVSQEQFLVNMKVWVNRSFIMYVAEMCRYSWLWSSSITPHNLWQKFRSSFNIDDFSRIEWYKESVNAAWSFLHSGVYHSSKLIRPPLKLGWQIVPRIYSAFSCYPLALIIPSTKHCINVSMSVDHHYTLFHRPDCLDRIYNFNAIMNIITDFAILLIPIWPVLQLQINKKRKIHLLVVFCLGFM